MTFLKLFKRIVLKHICEDRFLTALSVLGVALGVGLFMGVNIASDRSASSFESSIRGIDSVFNYQVVHVSGIDFNERTYRDLREAAGAAMPVLTTSAYLPGQGQTLDITGVYSASAFGVMQAASGADFDFEAFFTRLNAVLVPKAFSDEHNLRKGDGVRAIVYNREYDLFIAGILDDPSVPANMVLMDLGNYQEFFGKTGVVSRIDIIADRGETAAVARVLPGDLVLENKEQFARNRASLIDGFRFNLKFVTFLAVLVGVFLLYNTVFMSVVKRRTEIGVLRGLGMSRTTVVALFTAQGVLLGVIGSVLGIAFGQASAWAATGMVGKTVAHFYGSGAPAGDAITTADAVRTLVFGFVVSVVASLVPAFDSATVRPMESSRPGTLEKSYKARQRLFSLIGVFLVVISAVITFIDYRYVPFAFPWLSHAAILLFILGCTFLAPAYLGAAVRAIRHPLHSIFKTAGRVAAADIRGTRYRFSLALMSVAVSSALIIAIVSSVHSLKSSFIGWINTYLSADVYIKAASCTANFCLQPLPEEVVATVARNPAVESVGAYRVLQVDFNGQKIIAGFGNSEELLKHWTGISAEEKERSERLARHHEVHISDYLAVRYGLEEGDTIELQTPRGKAVFTVNDISISYSTMSGFLYLDRRWLKEYWGLDDATQLSVHLKEGQHVQAFMDRLRSTLGRRYALDITDNAELRKSVLAIFDRSFAITYTIELIAIVISLIGVVNALLILVLEKKRDISILRYLGATWGDIRRVIVLSAGLVGAAGIALGIVMGAAISIVITRVINKISFGWEVDFQVPLLTVTLLMALLFVITTLAGIVPAYLAKKIDPKAFISFE